MNKLEKYGLVRFSKRTGKIDTTLTALGRGMIQMWALQNTPETKACIILNLDEREVFAEYIGTEDGFPIIHKNEDEFEYEFGIELYEAFDETG